MRRRQPAVLAKTQRRLLEVLVDAERGRVLDRRVVDLDAGPVVAEDRGGACMRRRGSGDGRRDDCVHGGSILRVWRDGRGRRGYAMKRRSRGENHMSTTD